MLYFLVSEIIVDVREKYKQKVKLLKCIQAELAQSLYSSLAKIL